jgi:hypothetical protein
MGVLSVLDHMHLVASLYVRLMSVLYPEGIHVFKYLKP